MKSSFLSVFDVRRYQKARSSLDEVNYRNFLYYTSLTSLICLVTGLFDVFSTNPKFKMESYSFLGVFFFTLLAFLFGRFVLKDHKNLTLWFFYAVETVVMAGGIMLGTYWDPKEYALTLLVLICVLPIFIADVYWRWLLFLAAVTVAFLCCDYFAKGGNSALFQGDCYDLAFFLFVSVCTNIHTHENVLKRVEENIMLAEKADKDPLTGLLNRGTGVEQISRCLQNGDQGTFLIIDIDDFKSVNDNFSHMTGDKALIKFAAALQASFTSEGTLMRMGGDEFGVFLLHQTDKEAVAKQILAASDLIGQIVIPEAQSLKLHASFGAAIFRSSDDFNSLYRRADQALYKAKSHGKDRFFIADQSD
jgi:diguanylate cyclase (GGDEF)-like protein